MHTDFLDAQFQEIGCLPGLKTDQYIRLIFVTIFVVQVCSDTKFLTTRLK